MKSVLKAVVFSKYNSCWYNFESTNGEYWSNIYKVKLVANNLHTMNADKIWYFVTSNLLSKSKISLKNQNL